jgi:hypothetical protein
MVKDLFKKVEKDLYLWILLYGVKLLNVFRSWPGFQGSGEKIMGWGIASLQVLLLSIIMRRWKFPYSWIVVFILMAFMLHTMLVTSVTNVGLLILMLGYYYKEFDRLGD